MKVIVWKRCFIAKKISTNLMQKNTEAFSTFVFVFIYSLMFFIRLIIFFRKVGPPPPLPIEHSCICA